MKDSRLLFLDGCRGVAAIIVVLLHACAPFWPQALAFANLAVDFFFMLSAFVLMQAYGERLRKGLSLRRFMYIRWLRLFPLHASGLLMGFLLFSARYGVSSESLLSFGLNLAFLPSPHALAPGWPSAFGLNIPAWSLFFEWIANILLGLLLVHLSPLAIRRVCIVLGVLYAIQLSGQDLLWVGGSFDDLHLGVLRVLYPFSLGIWLWHAWKASPGKAAGPAGQSALLALLVLTLLAPSAGGKLDALYMFCAISLAFPLIIRLGADIEPQGQVAGLMGFLGHISYGLYVTHASVLRILTNIWRSHDFDASLLPLFFLLEIGVAALFAWLLTRWFDTPARATLTRWRPA